MTIVIKAEEINKLIYRYFLEQGMNNSAFSLLHEANLKNQENQDENAQSGQLVTYLEKALMFNQIESHIFMNEYCECIEPYSLLGNHICRITERKQEAKIQENIELDQGFISMLSKNHENDVQKQEQVVCSLDENFLSIFGQKIEMDSCPSQALWNQTYDFFILYQKDRNFLYYLKQQENQKFQPIAIVPLSFQEDDQFTFLQKMMFTSSKNYLICVINSQQNDYLMTLNCLGERMILFQLSQGYQNFEQNKNFENIIAVQFTNQIEIIDILNANIVQVIDICIIQLNWRVLNEFTVIDNNGKIINLNIDQQVQNQFDQEMDEYDLIQWNETGTLLSSMSYKENFIKIWTNSSNEFILSFNDEDIFQTFKWASDCNSINSNLLIAVTKNGLKVWDVEFGNLKWKIRFNEQ